VREGRGSQLPRPFAPQAIRRCCGRVHLPLMPDHYRCPKCGRPSGAEGRPESNVRFCPPPLGCGYQWEVPDGPLNSG
jgi:hypothetical protein